MLAIHLAFAFTSFLCRSTLSEKSLNRSPFTFNICSNPTDAKMILLFLIECNSFSNLESEARFNPIHIYVEKKSRCVQWSNTPLIFMFRICHFTLSFTGAVS